jgi:phospholipid/cholesterol/gamma-HCH transport system substrate-binding protein
MKRRDEVLVGVFIVVALIVGVIGTLWLAGRAVTGASYPLHARFDWGQGLRQGQPVLLAGVQIGTVARVELNPSGFLDVTMRIEREYGVPLGSTAVVQSVGFFGDQSVAISPPRPFTRTYYEAGDTVTAGAGAPGLDDILARVDTLGRSVTDVAQAFELQMVQRGGLDDLRQTIVSTNRLMDQLAAVAAEQSRQLTATMMSIRRTTQALDSASIDSTVRNMNAVSANLTSVTAGLSESTARLNGIMASIEDGEGSVGLLLNDPGLYHDMRNLVARLDSLTADLKANPRRYLNIRVF